MPSSYLFFNFNKDIDIPCDYDATVLNREEKPRQEKHYESYDGYKSR